MSIKTTSAKTRKAAANSDLVNINWGAIGSRQRSYRKTARRRRALRFTWDLLRATGAAGGSISYRYRAQLWPLWLLGILILAGWAATLATVAAAALLSILASAAVLFHLRGKLPRKAERAYALSCLGVFVAWVTAVSAVGLDQPTVNVPGVIAWALGSILWWQHHQLRAKPQRALPTGIEELWAANVGGEKCRAAAGAEIEPPVPIEHGEEYPIQGVPGVHHIGQMQAALPLISSGLRTPLQYLLLESEPAPEGRKPDPSRFRLRVVTRSPIDKPVFFTQPTVTNGRIHLGPYADGEGDMTWRIFTDDSMWGGFVLGGTGAGKSRLIELIALVARSMGVTVLYLDGQEGASSPILWQHATWRGGPKEARGFLAALERGKSKRQVYNRVHGLSGFNPEPGGPTPVLTIIDECHKIFRPETGARWGELAREIRKLGMGIIGASQYSGLDTFGGNDALRSSLLEGNAIAMRTSSRVSAQLIPGLELDPAKFPTLPGFSYYVAPADSEERTAPGRVQWLPGDKDMEKNPRIPVPTVRAWFERITDPDLDKMTAHAFGEDFLNRHLLAERRNAEDWAALAGDEFHVDAGAGAGEPVEESSRAEDEKGKTCAQQILTLPWTDYDGEMERAQIIAELPSTLDVSTIRKALTKLIDDGALVRTSRGNYQRPGRAA